MRKKGLLFGVLAILLTTITSCYKYSDVKYLDELDVTYTQYDNEFNFTPLKTIAVRDCVVLVENHWTDDERDKFYATNGGSDQIIDLITKKFEAIGYDVVGQDQLASADLAINPVLMHIENTGTVWYPPFYPGWGWGYWPYYGYSSSYYYGGYPGWGWGGYYPWYGYTYSYKTGTLSLEMADGNSIKVLNDFLKDKDRQEIEADKSKIPGIKLVWTAAIDGYVSSSKEYNSDRAERGMDEAITQSPFLIK